MAAQVKKYDPNQYNFGNFAKTMNQNFAIERAQNGQGGAFGVNGGVNAANPVNLGGTTNSQTLGNLGTFGTRDRYNNITGNFTGLLKRFNSGEQVIFGEPSSSPLSDGTVPAKTGGSAQTFPQFAEEYKPYDRGLMQGDNVISNWNGQPPQTQPPQQEPKQEIITEQEPKQEIITDEGSSVKTEGTGTETGGTGTVTDPTLEKFIGIANDQVNAGEGAMDFETWQSAYSVDPVVEYQNAQAQLDYEFKTWMSDYGARAEQLYQMGLSNSGVSDIYGANAYTAYVQASMDLKRAQIQQQKENRQMYQKYVDEYEAAKAAKTEATNAKIATAFNSYAGSYTPDQEQSVRIALAAQGFDITAIESIIGQLNAYYQSLPEGSRPDALANEANVTAALNWLNTNYTSGMTDEELSAMLGATYSEDVAKAALEKFAPFKAVIDRLSGDEAAKNAFSAMLEMMSAGDTDVESLKAKAKGLGYSEDAIAKAAENIAPFVTEAQGNQVDSATIINDAAVRIATTIFTNAETGESTYTGSESQKNYIRQLMQLAEYKDVAPYVEEIIAKMDENLSLEKQADIDEITKELGAVADVTPETIVMDALLSNLTEYKTQLAAGKITQEQYDQYASSFSNSAVKAYEWAVKSVDNMADAYAMFGFDEAEWSEMDDAQRESAIMEEMAEYRTEGLLSAEGYNSVVKSWADSEIKVAIDTDKENGQATGLRAFGAIASMLLDWKDSGSLTDNEYLEQIENIISTSGLFVDDKIRWSTVPNADAHIRMNGMDSVGYIRDEDLISVLDKNEPKSGGSYVAYNDKLYVKRYNKYAGGYVWQPLDIDHYTLPGTGAAFSKKEREGIHELLKILYGVKPPKDTRR